MNIYDFLFISQFVILMAITMLKMYNIFTVGNTYDVKWSFILFITFVIAWFVGLSIFMIQPERTIFMVLFYFGNFFFVINTLFLIAEILISIGAFTSNYVQRYQPERR